MPPVSGKFVSLIGVIPVEGRLLQSARAPRPNVPDSSAPKIGSGQPVRRLEDHALLTGAGCFADDVAPPGAVHACFLRSPHAHARILGIDTAAARALPGVIAIYSGADLVRDGVKPIPNSADFKRPDGSPTASPCAPSFDTPPNPSSR